MIFRLDYSDSRAIYLQIMDEIRRAIVLGSLQPDEPLPSVRQLATELRINPNTVGQAYRELEREGIVYVRRGRGTFVAVPRDSDSEKRGLASELAKRTLHEAFRLGLSLEELITAIGQAAANDKEQR